MHSVVLMVFLLSGICQAMQTTGFENIRLPSELSALSSPKQAPEDRAPLFDEDFTYEDLAGWIALSPIVDSSFVDAESSSAGALNENMAISPVASPQLRTVGGTISQAAMLYQLQLQKNVMQAYLDQQVSKFNSSKSSDRSIGRSESTSFDAPKQMKISPKISPRMTPALIQEVNVVPLGDLSFTQNLPEYSEIDNYTLDNEFLAAHGLTLQFTDQSVAQTVHKRTFKKVCEPCGNLVFNNSGRYYEHLHNKHPQEYRKLKPFACDRCLGDFTTKKRLAKHVCRDFRKFISPISPH